MSVDRTLVHEFRELVLGLCDGLRSPLSGTIDATTVKTLLHTPSNVAGNVARNYLDDLDTDVS